MIENRPKELDLPNKEYISPIWIEFFINKSQIPNLLKLQLETLFWILPIPADLKQEIFRANPSKKEIHYHKKNNSRFQLITIVLNMHSCIDKEWEVQVYPYSLSLSPWIKKWNIENINISFIENYDIKENMLENTFYSDYSPFHEKSGIICWANLIGSFVKNKHLDSIWFIIGSYFLNTNCHKSKIAFPTLSSTELKWFHKQIHKYCQNIFCKPFKDDIPRVVWWANSPIELFVIQGLARKNLFPTIQTDIFKDGTISAHFYSRIQDDKYIKHKHLITSTDLYFEDVKLAIFCDWKEYHSWEKEEKDKKINEELNKLWIVVLRFSWKKITENLDNVIQNIEKEYKKLKK